MDMTSLVFPRGNDVVVTAQYGPEITTGTGMNAELYTKDNRSTPDSDPSVQLYTADVHADPDNAAQFISTLEVPSSDTGIPGAYWWRVDIIDAFSARRTVNSGPLLVEAV